MTMLQQSMPEYLEIRQAQMDVLCAQLDLMAARMRLANLPPGGSVIKRFRGLQKEAQEMKKRLAWAEHSDQNKWQRLQARLESRYSQFRRMAGELAIQTSLPLPSSAGMIRIYPVSQPAVQFIPESSSMLQDTTIQIQ